jgi:hypothetical protein
VLSPAQNPIHALLDYRCFSLGHIQTPLRYNSYTSEGVNWKLTEAFFSFEPNNERKCCLTPSFHHLIVNKRFHFAPMKFFRPLGMLGSSSAWLFSEANGEIGAPNDSRRL